MYSEAQEIAAKCLAGQEGSAGLLNYQLAEEIDNIDGMCKTTGGQLRSRQVIAAIIMSWSARNPDARAYGE